MNPMVRLASCCLAIPAVPMLAGCTTIGGQSILRTSQPKSADSKSIVPSKYNVAGALAKFYTAEQADRRDIRDEIIGLYLAEENARFNEYKNAIKVDMRQGNFLLDIFGLGLSSAASVASKKTANTLSAGASAVTGTRASFNKNIYFEQTMNSLLTQMNTAHDRVSNNIRLRMQNESADTYSLSQFFDDLARLEGAGTVEQAIQQAALEAGQKAEDQQAEFEVQTVSGVPSREAIDLRLFLRSELAPLITSPPARSAKITAAAGAVGADVGASDDDTVRNIRVKALPITDAVEAEAFAKTIKKALASAPVS